MAIEYAGSRRDAPRRAVDLTTARDVVRRFDLILLAAVVAIVAYGLHVIAGITRSDVQGDADYFVVRQAAYAALGGVGLFAISLVDPDLFRRYWRHLFGGSLAILIVVLAPIGTEARGSQRWLSLGPLTFQPSELVKLTLVLAVAGFLADRARRLAEWRTVLSAVGLVLATVLLVFLQPDVGTALVYVAAGAGILFVGGARWTHIATLAATTALVAALVVWVLPSAGIEVLEDYQANRLSAFVDPSRDPSGASYNVAQSKTAIGAGGLRGRGVEGATQTNLEYLPEHETDFAFAALAEQRGFMGASILLLLYLLVVWRGIRVITLSSDAFTAMVAGGIVLGFLFQIYVNVGMTMGIAPVTGIPLPFVSVGGSAMVSNLLAMGVLQAIHARSTGRRR